MQNRRQFLGQTTAATAALSVTAVGHRSWSSPAIGTVVCAVIGVGGRGAGLMNQSIEHKSAAVAAVCDVNQRSAARAAASAEAKQNRKVRQVDDFRRILDDKSIDAVIIAAPHHWHSPIAIRALQAGKHVYVEKPASHVFREGRLLVEAARSSGRVMQHGTQMRSSAVTIEAGKVLASGLLGEIKLARAWSIEPRNHPNPVPDAAPPEYLDYDQWLGPAPERPSNFNRLNRWRWYRDYGNGEMGDDGIHDIDLACWGLGVDTHPVRISAQGASINLKGETEYPNHLNASFQYSDGREILYETRNWAYYKMHGFDSGNAFYGTEGYMIFSRRGYFQTYLGPKEEQGPGLQGGGGGGKEHIDSFFRAITTDGQPTADAATAHLSCALVHLGEIAYRTGRVVQFDPESETIRNDREANSMLSKNYRSPWGFAS